MMQKCLCYYRIIIHIYVHTFLYFFVEFKPPQIFTHIENESVHANWSLSPDQELSISYLEFSRQGWFLTGNCTDNGIIIVS